MPMRQAKQFVEYCRQSCDVACVDLSERQLLTYYNSGVYTVRDVKNDRNCIYRALSMGMYGTQSFYRQVRESIVTELNRRYAHYESVFQKFVNTDTTLDTELDAKQIITLNPTWGDSVVASIAANALSRPIMIVTVAENGTKVRVESFLPEGTPNCTLERSLVLELREAQCYRVIVIQRPDAVMVKASRPRRRRHPRMSADAAGRLLDPCQTSRDCGSSGHFCESNVCVDDTILADLPIVPEPARTTIRFQLPARTSRLSLGPLRKCQSSSQCDSDLGLFCDRGICVNDRIYNHVMQQNNLEESRK